MSIPIIILILSIIYVSEAQKIKCDDKDAENLDLMIQRLYLFGAADRRYPTRQSDMQKFCRENTEFQNWLKEYSEKCLENLSRQMLNLMMYSVTKHNNGVCKSGKRSQEFLKLGSCGNAAKKGTIKCWTNLIKSIDAISYHKDDKMKIPLSCCNYYAYKDCNLRAYESKPKYCDRVAIDGHEKLVNVFAIDNLKLLCSDYTEESDKCDRIIHQTGKSNLKKLPHSAMSTFIKILNSIE